MAAWFFLQCFVDDVIEKMPPCADHSVDNDARRLAGDGPNASLEARSSEKENAVSAPSSS